MEDNATQPRVYSKPSRECHVTELRSMVKQPVPDLGTLGQVGRRALMLLHWLQVTVTAELQTGHRR